eukprot:m.58819 g.58819  ORF g.58819 m.58819 type:complete len:706 (+) comp13795_c0_seq1:83-2200(+)
MAEEACMVLDDDEELPLQTSSTASATHQRPGQTPCFDCGRAVNTNRLLTVDVKVCRRCVKGRLETLIDKSFQGIAHHNFPLPDMERHLGSEKYAQRCQQAHETLSKEGIYQNIATPLDNLATLTATLLSSETKAGKKAKKPKAQTGTAWSHGTGFGGAANSGLNHAKVARAHKQQDTEDMQYAQVFDGLSTGLEAWSDSQESRQSFSPGADMGLQWLLGTSNLGAAMRKFIRNDALSEVIVERSSVYSSLLGLLEQLASTAELALTLHPHWGAKKHFSSLVSNTAVTLAVPKRGKRRATTAVTHIKMEADETDYVEQLDRLRRQAKTLRRSLAQDKSSTEAEMDPEALIPRIETLYNTLKTCLKHVPSAILHQEVATIDLDNDDDDDIIDPEEQASKQNQSLRDTYVKELKGQSFRMIKINYETHAFLANIQGSAGGGVRKDRMRRITKEISSLAAALPLAYEGSIFVRADETRPDVIKAMIIGPEDTPYANGCFLFDIFLPLEYPHMPPLVNIVTTDGGRVRFNPNLYKAGKVCLSLLGTWQGPGWDPTVSTLLQVLLSIQSLIMVPDPYYNEPGFERRATQRESTLYNSALQYQTARVAILGLLQAPPEEFTAAIRTHFRCKKDAISKQLQDWLSAAEDREMLPHSHTPFNASYGGAHAFRKRESLGYFHDLYVPDQEDLDFVFGQVQAKLSAMTNEAVTIVL